MKNSFLFRFFIIVLLGVLLFFIIQNNFIKAPKDFPVPHIFSIKSGQTLFSISEELKNQNIISSKRVFESIVILLGDEKKIAEGEYVFSEPIDVFSVAFKIIGKDFLVYEEKITFPEGFSNQDMALRLKDKIPEFDHLKFLNLSSGKQGYLFPDTYQFPPSVTPEIVIDRMEKNFLKKTESLELDFKSSKRSREDIIKMAAIIEKEASGKNDSAIISGILWKRIDIGMLLQVDAPFLYLLGKESSELTRNDLAMDSPYNTYKYKGLTPTPISNPGFVAIEAALNPKDSPYLYYLHDVDGNIHYAVDYKGHQENIKKYLRNN